MSVIIFKPTEKCNSNCAYCDVVAKKRSGIVMAYDLLELVFVKINEYLVKNPQEHRLTFIWHGGEPALLGAEYFKKAREFQNKHCKKTKKRIEHAVQSNLTIINQEILTELKKLGIDHVGTSYEPLPNFRGPGEDRDSEQYNRNFMKGVNLLEKNDMGWGVIYVVHKYSLLRPLDIFYFLGNLKLRGGFNFNPVLIYDDNKKYLSITPEEYSDFLGAIFPVWWKYRHRYPHVNPFMSLTKNIRDKDMGLGCVDSGRCDYHHVYIGPTGETSQCGRAGDWNLVSYGNITERSLDEIFKDPKRDEFARRNELLIADECKDCRIWEICHGGCPLDAHYSYGTFSRKTGWCEFRKSFVEKYFEPVTGLKAEFKPDLEPIIC